MKFHSVQKNEKKKKYIADASMIDVGFVGNKFTWSKNRKNKAYVVARLDRQL